ncbi:hypothetical protein [Pseudomonas sp. 28 E 9]|nr:hypothetical protein [Pseudomonas sp. 28 E 9]
MPNDARPDHTALTEAHPIPHLLEQLLLARGPGGQEDGVRAICLERLRPLCDETWVDPAGNDGAIEACALTLADYLATL